MPIEQWKTERHYLPSVVTLDAVRKNAEQFMFKRELPKHRNMMAVDAAMREPNYQGPDKETWEMYTSLIGARNKIAGLLSISPVNGLDAASGYDLDPSIANREKLPIVDLHKLRVGRALHRVNENKVSDSQQAELLIPMLRAIDYVISKMERLCWDEAYPKYKNNYATDLHLRTVSHSSPELVRDALHEVRRHLADFCVLPKRTKHDFDQNPPWLLSVDGQYDLDPRDTIPQSKVKITA
jgi:hypothetical protein